mgnify:CR=1 FL=1
MTDRDFLIERNILKIGNQLLNIRSEDLKEFDLTSTQSETLLFFDKHSGAMIYDLKDHMKISHQAARNIVERMKEKDLLYVEISDTDARAKKVYLSEKGKKICGKLKKRGTDVGSSLLRALQEEEKQELARLLEKIIKIL